MNLYISNQNKAANLMSRIKSIHVEVKKFNFKKFTDTVKMTDRKHNLEDQIHNLLLCERLFNSISFELVTTDIEIVTLRLLNVYMLMKCYC